jgi:hypothetical protein
MEVNMFKVTLKDDLQIITPLTDDDKYVNALYKTLHGKTLTLLSIENNRAFVLSDGKLYVNIPVSLLQTFVQEQEGRYYLSKTGKILAYPTSDTISTTGQIDLTDEMTIEQTVIKMLESFGNISMIQSLAYSLCFRGLDRIKSNLLSMMSKAEVSLWVHASNLNMTNVFKKYSSTYTKPEEKELLLMYCRRLCIEHSLNIPLTFTGKGYELGELETIEEPVLPLGNYSSKTIQFKEGDAIIVTQHDMLSPMPVLWSQAMVETLVGLKGVVKSTHRRDEYENGYYQIRARFENGQTWYVWNTEVRHV